MKTFASVTTVMNPETNVHEWFYPGDECPEWAEKLVSNPNAFMQEDVEDFTQGVDYSAMTVPQLVELAKTRGLQPDSTKKSDLVKMLEKNDGAGD